MRKALYLSVVVALVASSLTPSLSRQGIASAQSSEERTTRVSGWDTEFGPAVRTSALANFDVRQIDNGENLQEVLADDPVAKRRVAAIEKFRAKLDSTAPDSLKFELNRSRVPKMFFSSSGPLSVSQSGTHDEIARQFLTENSDVFGLNRAEVRRLKLGNQDSDPTSNITFLNYEQTISRITVFHGHVQVAVGAGGEVLSVNEGYLLPGASVRPRAGLPEEDAISKAFEYSGRQMAGSLNVSRGRDGRGEDAVYQNPLGSEYAEVVSGLRVIEVNEQPVLAWHSYIDIGSNEWYEICVDANTGELLYRYNLYNDVAQGTVFRQNPGAGARTLESFVGDTIINTSAGWMGTSTVTTGNNVEAYLDTDANNTPDANNTTGLSNGHASAADQNFTFPFSTGVDPRTQRPAVVTNLFYFCNIMHDFVYNLGFTESAGNFQTNNFGRGGVGNDSVRAEAQDGSGTNNANFGTPPDGQRPRMQQFLFTQGTTSLSDDRDSSQDGDVVLHEFGHGVSNRLVGGPANTSCLGGTQAGAMGEGWSDYWAITFYNDGRVGEYVVNNPTRGIRRAAYTVPAAAVHDSYADLGVGGFEVHNDGEVWAATLWDLRTQLGAAVADRLVLQGMKFTPCSPSMLNARDGILQADQNINASANRCAIWTVFARHGMGVSAQGNNGTTHVAATDVPADCAGGGGGGATTVFFDNFETNLGWVANPNGTDTATTGRWQRANPETTTSNGTKQVGTTVSGVNDLVTGALAGASAGVNDIDGGVTSIRSPNITLPSSGSLVLSFSAYLAHGTNASTADFLRVRIVSGTTTTTVFQRLGAAQNVNGAFVATSVSLNAFAGQTINILIEAADAAGASLVEAGVDDVRIVSQ
jgi:extracellular elastinolytic metalloproteinase